MTEQRPACLRFADFESRAFGFPYYRVERLDERLSREVGVIGPPPVAADAKIPASDVSATRRLMNLGFRKVCVQITLVCDLSGSPEDDSADVRFADRLDLDDSTIMAHARNFTQDRYSLDPLLPSEGRLRLYYQWLGNSLSGVREVAYLGTDLCTFSHNAGELRIDLVSILEKRRGHGARLIAGVLNHARRIGASSVRVVTECENTAAWNLYLRRGFSPVEYTSVLHLVLPS